jgi:hypothetical protein
MVVKPRGVEGRGWPYPGPRYFEATHRPRTAPRPQGHPARAGAGSLIRAGIQNEHPQRKRPPGSKPATPYDELPGAPVPLIRCETWNTMHLFRTVSVSQRCLGSTPISPSQQLRQSHHVDGDAACLVFRENLRLPCFVFVVTRIDVRERLAVGVTPPGILSALQGGGNRRSFTIVPPDGAPPPSCPVLDLTQSRDGPDR